MEAANPKSNEHSSLTLAATCDQFHLVRKSGTAEESAGSEGHAGYLLPTIELIPCFVQSEVQPVPVPKMERLGHCRVFFPATHDHAVGSHDQACTIFPMLAMEEDRASGRVNRIQNHLQRFL
jgi:hypothetical protein